MNVIKFLITILLLICSIIFILGVLINKALKKKGLNVLFSASGLFSLKYLKINIDNRYLQNYSISDLEILLTDVSLKIRSWKLKLVLSSCKLKFYINNNEFGNNIGVNVKNIGNQKSSNYVEDKNDIINNDIGIIRNLILIVIIQIISRTFQIEFHNIEFNSMLTDCSCNDQQKISDNICRRCERSIRYGVVLKLVINSLFMSAKTHIGGVMFNLKLNNAYFIVYPTENTISYKRCYADYMNSKGEIDYNEVKSNDSVLKYIINQFKSGICDDIPNTSFGFPPLLYIKDELNVDIKLMHSIYCSNINIFKLENLNIHTNRLWFTLVVEVICELIYIYHIYIKNNRNRTKIHKREENSMNINDFSPDTQITNSNRFDVNSDNNYNYNFHEQIKVNCNILNPVIIFCDNTKTSSGFELIFDEFESNLMIQYYKEYFVKNEITGGYSDIFDDDSSGEFENFSYNELDFKKKSSKYRAESKKSERIIKSFKLLSLSRMVTGNSIIYSNPDKNSGFSVFTKTSDLNEIKDGHIIFDRMFIVDRYKSLFESSSNNSIKLYFRNSIQKVFGFWKENGFYQNLSLFLQLIRFRKYLLKIDSENSSTYIDNYRVEFTNEILNIPLRTEPDENDIINSYFTIENNSKLLEIKNNPNIDTNLLFYFDIKDLIIQTRNISLSNNELFDLKNKHDTTNNHCESCFIDSFGPNERYDWRIIVENCCDYNLNNDNRYFTLIVKHLKLCNTSLNRNCSMLFKDLKLFSMKDFVDLEDISFNYLIRSGDINDKHDSDTTCIHKYGCFNQQIKSFRYQKVDFIKESKLFLVKGKEVLINIPWDYKKISLRVSKVDGDLSLSYIPIYLYLFSCFTVDSISLKNSSLHKIYYGVNNKFEGNIDYYIEKRTNYYNEFSILKNKLTKLVTDISPLEVLNRNIENWTIPDIIISKSGKKYTWYFNFEDINVNFYNNFKLIIKYLSLYRCNEYGNYDIVINNMDVIDSKSNNIISSNKIRLRSDIPFKSIKIESPICLKKQLRRLLDLSINGDLLLLHILGDQNNVKNNLENINNGLIYFDSKRFILEVDCLKMLILNNIHYMESLFEYIYKYVYISYYQLFHPPITIRLGKLLSYSRKHPIVFSCNNIFDFDIRNCSIHFYELNNILLNDKNTVSTQNNCILFSKDDSYIHSFKVSSNNDVSPSEDMNWKRIIDVNNKFNVPIIDINFDLLRIHIRTKHISNVKSNCDDKECYNLPNYLLYRFDNSKLLINPDYNPFNIFGYTHNFALNMHNSVNNIYNNVIYSRNELIMDIKCLFFDVRRIYNNINRTIEGNKTINSDLSISIYSNNKLEMKISNINSYESYKKLLPLMEIIKRGSRFKYRNNKRNEYGNNSINNNTFINEKVVKISLNVDNKMKISISPYTKGSNDKNRYIYDNQSIDIILGKIDYLLNIEYGDKSNIKKIKGALNIQDGLNINLNSVIFNNIHGKFDKKYSIIHNLVNTSKLALKYNNHVNSEINIDLLLNGIERDLYINRNLKTKMHMSNNILTVNINNEKANTITQIMELFFDYDNFHNIKMYYCVTCMEYKYKNEIKQVKKGENGIMDILFGKLHYKLNATLSDIHIKYEFFGLIINKAMLNLQNSNNHHHVTRKFKFNINDMFLFVEAYPLKYNTLILINEAKKSGNTVNNIKLISSFNSKTKIINFLHIGKALFNINLTKNTKEDDDIIVIDSIKLSLNMLLLIYFEAFLKIIKYNNNCNNSSNSSNLNIQILNNLKLNVQINNLFVNTYIINSRDIHSRQTNNNIYEDCNNLNLTSNINDIDDLLSTILNKNPIYNTIKVVDEYNNCNETMKIFNIDKMDCIECKYRVNGVLLYSSYIKIDHCKNNSIYINNYMRKYTNNRNKSTFSIYNEYKKINIYNETHNNNLIEYGIFTESLFEDNNSDNHCYHNYHYDQENFMNTFKQIILNVNNIDLILLFKENNKLELLLKMLPLSIHIAISNNLLWNLSEHEIINSDNKIHLIEYNEDYYLNNISNKNMEEKSTEYYLDNKNAFIVSETDEYEDKLIINDFYENENNDNTYELLKTTPIFINFCMNVLKYNQNIRMYCNSLFLSIDSNRVQTINEVLNSFDYRTTLLKQSNVSVISNCNNSNLLSSIASSNVTFSNNNLTPVAFSNLNGINNTSLPPSIYYSNNNSTNTIIHHDNTNCYNIGNTNNLDNNSDIYYVNNNIHSTFRTPSSISFSSYFNENIKTNNSINNDDICNNYNDFNNCNNNNNIAINNYHRLSILNMLSIDFEKQNDNISKHNKRMSINNNKSQNIEDLNNKNINNILKYEIDKYLMNNPLSYTMIDNIQNQQSFDGDNMQVINNNIQVEFIIDKLNIDMFIDRRMFSNFRSTEINIVLLSNKQKDKSTIIEFDASSINLVANKDFFYNEGHNSMQNNCNVNTNLHNNINSDNVSIEEKVPIICPMYIDGHTSQGHGHVLSVRINMRQIKLLELFNIRILESVIIRVNPIKVNITQYLTSCYYDIFFKTQTNVTNTSIALNNISNTNVNNPNNNNGCNIEFYTDNNNYVSNCNVGNNYDNIYIETNNNSDNNDNNTNFNNANTNNGNYNINHVLIGDINNGSTSLFMNNDITEKKILYFNYLRISSILAEVTYRGSVSLNKVLFELSSFTQRRKCRTFKGMIDKYLSFLRRQAARPVISYTFKQIKQSLLPKHFKSLKRNSNYNTHYNYLYNDNQSGYSSSNIHSFSMNYNASQNDLIDLNYGNEANSKYEKYYNNNYNDLYNNNNSSSSNNTHNNDNRNITSIHNNTNPRNSNFNRSNFNSNSRVDSEYSKFRLLFGNQLLF
ncbi:hypothetical protein FG379_000770 [Cryptosporidium bovis]|uniref:uncharacterized protein n=1 Tax=Cryptosporidium bovis TaxID=310047 RepID=UPI003519E206|nr:hypothetical protein FG379_000770 [Cryptosporidium bovis]